MYHQDRQIHVVVQTIIIDIMCHQQQQIVKQPHKHQINYLHLMGSIAWREQKVTDKEQASKKFKQHKILLSFTFLDF